VLDEVLTLEDAFRKNVAARRASMAGSDIVLLCLPDDAARDAARMAREANPSVRILDASAAHRCDAEWQYGLSELFPRKAIREAQFVANPGCFATGCILLSKPLSSWCKYQFPTGKNGLPWMAFQGVTGFSAGGVKTPSSEDMPYLAQLGTAHRHLPEIERYALVSPTLTTLVGNWYQGMLVQSTVQLDAEEVFEMYAAAYNGHENITVSRASPELRRLSAVEQNGTTKVHIVVASQPGGCVVAAAYDNLGKGSAGAAADNLRLMLT
jgi:N-acetyl-gamma-glutamyl-phosphate reductase